MTKISIPALAAALAFSAASMAPAAAFAQSAPSAAPPAPVQTAPVPPPGAPATTAPGTPTTAAPGAPTAAAPGASAATPGAPGTPDTSAAAPGAPGAPATPGAAPGTPGAPDATATAPGAAPPSATAASGTDQGNGTEAVDNPYGLAALWKTGDAVSHTVLVILAIMSLGSWYIIVTKLIEQTRLFSAAKAASREFWGTKSVREGVSRLKENSPFRFIAESGISASEHHEGSLTDSIDLHTWVTMSIQRAVDAINSRIQGGLAFLATVGSTSPFVGLFGTVWGIYHALTAIGIAGQASIDKVAGPVGEALIMTALGLATAVPAVLGYNWLIRRNKAALEKVRNFAADLHSVLLSGSRVGVGTPSSTTRAA
jgi:biopolymer transport protein ExbB